MPDIAHSQLTGADLHEPKGVASALSGQVYRANGAGSGSWQDIPAANWTLVRKTSDTSRASTTSLTADPHLTFPMSANKTYFIRGMLRVESYLTPDLTINWSLPASVSKGHGYYQWIDPAGTIIRHYRLLTAGAFPQDNINGDDSFPDLIIDYQFAVKTGGSSGTCSLVWAQRVSNATAAKILENSYLEYREV